jgi:hypothetical protein
MMLGAIALPATQALLQVLLQVLLLRAAGYASFATGVAPGVATAIALPARRRWEIKSDLLQVLLQVFATGRTFQFPA